MNIFSKAKSGLGIIGQAIRIAFCRHKFEPAPHLNQIFITYERHMLKCAKCGFIGETIVEKNEYNTPKFASAEAAQPYGRNPNNPNA